MSAMVMSTMIIDYDDNDDDDFIDYVLTMLMMVIMSNVIHADRFGSIGGLSEPVFYTPPLRSQCEEDNAHAEGGI